MNSSTPSSGWGESEGGTEYSGPMARRLQADGAASPESSSRMFDFEVGETIVPLKVPDEKRPEEYIEIPRPTFATSNSLRNLTEQLAKEAKHLEKEGKKGQLPLSPVSKRKSLMNATSSPYGSPGTLRAHGLVQAQALMSVGGSFHGLPRRRLSPAPPLLGGSLHSRVRSPRGNRGASLRVGRGDSPAKGPGRRQSSFREISPPPPPGPPPSADDGLEFYRSCSKSPDAPSGSKHGVGAGGMRNFYRSLSKSSDELSEGTVSLNASGGLESYRSRSKSPGTLSGSTKNLRALSPGPLTSRSKSPGTARLSRRSTRSQRRLSMKRSTGPVSILRTGRFSQASQVKESESAGPSVGRRGSPSNSEYGEDGGIWMSSRRYASVRRVQFWFQDEASVTQSYGTEDSMQFADLGLDDSGELSFEEDVGGKSVRGEMSFIEVMDMDGEGVRKGDDDRGYMVNRFNGSIIHEELGVSFGGAFNASIRSLMSDEDEDDARLSAVEEKGQHQLSESSFALPDFESSFSESPKAASARETIQNSDTQNSSQAPQARGFAPIPDLDASTHNYIASLGGSRELATCHVQDRPSPPPAPAEYDSISSLLSEESAVKIRTEERTPRLSNLRHQYSESSIDPSSVQEEAGSSTLKSKSDSLSETSSESPTGVSQLDHEDEKDCAGEVDDEGRGNLSVAVLKNLISSLE
jgi:hypothetical protein